jgi:Domain of unknown function (DUF5667)
MKFSIFKNRSELPRKAQEELRPRKEFIERGRERFLAAFDASPLAARADGARGSRVTMFAKLGVGIVAVLCVATGFSVYADTANVSATSPLYPWKRLSENVQLALTISASQKAQLQATFAVRRAQEIQTLQETQPSSTLIPRLTQDLDSDISNSLSAVVSGGADASVGSGTGNNSEGRGQGSFFGRGGTGNEAGGAGNGTTSIEGAVSSGIVTATSSQGEASVTVSSTEIVSSSESGRGSDGGRGSGNDNGPINVYCAAFKTSAAGVLIGHLEAGLAAHPGAFAEFNRMCGASGEAPAAPAASDTVGAAATSTIFEFRGPQLQTSTQEQGKGGQDTPARGADAAAGTTTDASINGSGGGANSYRRYHQDGGPSGAGMTATASGSDSFASSSEHVDLELP